MPKKSGESRAEKLFCAAEEGKADVVKRGLRTADVNITSNGGSTLLLVACFYGHVEVVEVLIESGADTDHADEDGDTALIVSSDKGFLGVVKLLLRSEADAYLENKNGWTALLRAAHQGHFDVVAILLESVCCDASMMTAPCGKNCLMFACKAREFKAAANIIEIVQNSIAKVLCMAQTKAGATSLHLILRAKATSLDDGHPEATTDDDNSQTQAILMLLDTSGDAERLVAMSDNCGCTALMCAAACGDVDTLQLLLESGAEIDCTDDEGDSALMYCCISGHQRAVELLVEYGADVNIKNARGFEPAERAMDMGHVDISESLGESKPVGDCAGEKGQATRVRFR
jgi:serine/threonine-protein phosphatase 6 regulatory ankyrin repeat subunit B